MAINVLKEAPDRVAIALSGMGAETMELVIREHRSEIERLEAALLAERERCAKIVALGHKEGWTNMQIIDEIRARGSNQ